MALRSRACRARRPRPTPRCAVPPRSPPPARRLRQPVQPAHHALAGEHAAVLGQPQHQLRRRAATARCPPADPACRPTACRPAATPPPAPRRGCALGDVQQQPRRRQERRLGVGLVTQRDRQREEARGRDGPARCRAGAARAGTPARRGIPDGRGCRCPTSSTPPRAAARASAVSLGNSGSVQASSAGGSVGSRPNRAASSWPAASSGSWRADRPRACAA